MIQMQCRSCQKELELPDKISFREECLHCGEDIHSCLYCKYYDTTSYNDCKESSADRVVDKERNNYCDYFQLAKTVESGQGLSEEKLAKKKLEGLFNK